MGQPTSADPFRLTARSLLAFLAGACAALLAATLILHSTAGIGNYIHWTIRFAGAAAPAGIQRHARRLSAIPSLAWTLPCVARRAWPFCASAFRKRRWAQIAAFALLATPFLFTLASLLTL